MAGNRRTEADIRKISRPRCHAATFSRIEPVKDFANMLTVHRPSVLNYFRTKKQFSSGTVKGLNRKINPTVRKTFGFRTLKFAKVCLYRRLGELLPANSGEETIYIFNILNILWDDCVDFPLFREYITAS